MTDVQLNYLECGDGFPLILLHGNGESSAYFERQLPAFAPHFHVFAPDTRGHGASPRGIAPFTIRQFADDLRAFMDAHGIVRAHILGFSDGANIAMAFALKYPERVARIVLNGGNLRPSGVKPIVQLPIVLGYTLCAAISCFDKRAVAKREMLGLMVFQPMLRAADLAGIDAPALVVAGTHDMIRQRHTCAIASALPNAQLALIEGNHFVAHENPSAFNAAVLQFLLEERS